MYCANCGKQIENGKAFCPYCGAAQAQLNAQPVSPVQPVDQVQPAAVIAATPTVKKSKKPLAVILSAVAVCLMAVVVCVFAFGGYGYKNLVSDYIAAKDAGDAEAVVELIPPAMWEKMCGEKGITHEKGLEYLEYGFKNNIMEMDEEYGTWERKVEVLSEEDCTEYTVRYVQEEAEEYGIEVEAMKQIEAEITTLSGGEVVETETEWYSLIQVGKHWYIWLG